MDVSSTSLPNDQLSQVMVVLESVSAVSVSGEVHWLVADHKPVLDLMSIQSEPVRIVREVELPQGHYGTITLKLAPTAKVILADGSPATLEVLPQDRVIQIPEFDFDDGREWAAVLLTFDVSESLRDFLATSTSQAQHFSPEVSVLSLSFGARG